MKFLSKKISLGYVILSTTISGFAIFLFCYSTFIRANKIENEVPSTTTNKSCAINMKRLQTCKYIQPLVYAKPSCEADELQALKQELTQNIEIYKQNNVLKTASIYVRTYGKGDWICINDTLSYKPGSLLKVPELITFLKDNELHPGLLDRKIRFDHYAGGIDKHPVFTSKSIELGHTYTVRELLKYMITYSDNNATILLNNIMNVALFKKIFTDLGFKEPDMTSGDYLIPIKDYVVFFESLYNAGYLNIEDSEFAFELLTHCDFDKGLKAGLPSDVMIAHKFGEAGNVAVHELHECGFVYSGNKRYIVAIMTQGKEFNQLRDFIKNISKIVYQRLNS